ncbi:hypothetical protein D6D23_03570 [Aureobasidium pullulans]|nr:hypothetical protein D6D23_03570 [Aureobasidium pullulans]
MSTITQTRTKNRSRSRSRPAKGSSKSARSVSNVQRTSTFADPNYSQPTPEPKSASLSPTWVEVHGTKRGESEPSTSYVRRSDLAEHTLEYPSDRSDVTVSPINGEPSVPFPDFRHPNGQRYVPLSTYCAPPGTALDGRFQDPVLISNYRRAKAMASSAPRTRSRSTTPRKRVVISTGYDTEDESDQFSPAHSPSWIKPRPDTPTSARFDSFGFKRAGSFLFSNITQPLISILILLAMIKGLAYLPRDDTLHSAHQTICDRFGNPVGLNCKGDMNFTIENVVSHCHNAADKVASKLDLTSAKATLEDVWDSCKHVVGDASNKAEDAKVVAGEVKEALCKISGSEGLVDCVKEATKKPRSKASKAFVLVGSVFSNPFSTSTRARRSSVPPLVSTMKKDSFKTSEGHLTSGRAENPISSAKSALFSSASSISSAFEHKVKEPIISMDPGQEFDSIMQSIMNTFPTQQATVQESTNKYSDSTPSTQQGFSISRAVEILAKVRDLQLRHDMAVNKAHFKYLRKSDPTEVTKDTGRNTKFYSNKVLKHLAYLQSGLDTFLDCVLDHSNSAVKELSRDISYGPWTESWGSFSLWHMGFTVTSVNSAFTALVNQPKQCRKHLIQIDAQVFKLLKTRKKLLAEIDYYLVKTLEPDFGTRQWPWTLLPRRPTFTLPRPCFWLFKCKKPTRSEEEKARAHRLLHLRQALRGARKITDGIVEIKELVDQGSYELIETQRAIEQHKYRVLSEPKYGRALLKGALVDIKVDRAILKKVIADRKALRVSINEGVWAREAANGTDVKAKWISKELGL